MNLEIVSKQTPKVIITQRLASQIAILHNNCPSKTEWSGLLVYQITAGDINAESLKDLEIRAEAVFPMNFGDASFTSFEGSPDWFKLFDEYPQVDPLTKDPKWFIGKIHSHHSMAVFHSQTDKTDLYETAPKLPLFLSVIVNYACEWDIQLAIAVESEKKATTWWKWKLKGFDLGNEETKEVEETPSLTYILKCVAAFDCDDWFLEQLNKVKEEKKKPDTSVINNYNKALNQGSEDDTLTRFISSRVISNVGDLLTLGSDLEEPTAAYLILKEVDKALFPNDIPSYTTAFKIYFEDWYIHNFHTINIDEKLVIKAIQHFIDFHKILWIHGPLTATLNELTKEYSLQQV